MKGSLGMGYYPKTHIVMLKKSRMFNPDYDYSLYGSNIIEYKSSRDTVFSQFNAPIWNRGSFKEVSSSFYRSFGHCLRISSIQILVFPRGRSKPLKQR